MTWGIPTELFVQIHVVLSLIGIATGLVVLYGLVTGKLLGGWELGGIVTLIEQRIAEGFDKNIFDQAVHQPAAAAVSHQYARILRDGQRKHSDAAGEHDDN